MLLLIIFSSNYFNFEKTIRTCSYFSFVIILRFYAKNPLSAGFGELSLQVSRDRIDRQRLSSFYLVVQLQDGGESDQI